MAQKLYEESNIQAIADAIREKNGETTTYKTSEMAAAISAITTGGGGDIEVEPIVLTGSQEYACAGPLAGKYISLFGDTISTNNLTNATNLFYDSPLEKIPFDLNFRINTNVTLNYMFNSCNKLKEIPKFNNCKPMSLNDMFSGCQNLRYLPEDFETWFDWTYIDNLTSAYNGNMSGLFNGCRSLRTAPIGFLSHGNPVVYYYYSIYINLFNGCYSLDEVIDLPIPYKQAVWTGLAFSNTFLNCGRIKNMTFETQEDKTPYVVQWTKQTIDLSNSVGWSQLSTYIINSNSGITEDKEVKDDTTYQALKNDPDWYATNIKYSRYNHDSAVATINSLPDTSAYLATAGGTNTIKFKGESGELTDGGAINTLTPEEIAVATAKGWTVTIS